MITKSEEEHIMEEAIGSKMADYLIKPLNPNQILLSLKKILDEKRLVGEKAMSDYQREFRELGMRLMDRLGREDWEDIHKRWSIGTWSCPPRVTKAWPKCCTCSAWMRDVSLRKYVKIQLRRLDEGLGPLRR